MAQAKKAVSLRRSMVESSKAFFAGMRQVWVSLSPLSTPEALAERYSGVWNSLGLRATSCESDKFICFASACIVG